MLPSLVDGVIFIFKNRPRRCQSPARLGTTIENVGDVGGGSGGDVRQGGWFKNGLRLCTGVEGREMRRYGTIFMVCCVLRRDGENTILIPNSYCSVFIPCAAIAHEGFTR